VTATVESADGSISETDPRVPARAANGAARPVMVAASVLRPPAARPGTVARTAQLDQLAESLAARLVLMVAPAGWGKTSLLRDWWLAAQDSGVAWLSVREGDNDQVRFWSGVVAALRTVAPDTGAAALEAVSASGAWTPGWVETLLVDDLARSAGPITLVLDDLHVITSPEVRAGFEFLVEHLPPTLSLVVAARCDPELPLARLRARGELAEIRADQLRFSQDEAQRLLTQTLGLAVPPEEVQALWQRTEGWAAGLYLAGLSLRGRTNGQMAGFVGAFAGDDRHIFDYLAAEVLAGLPSRIRAFLLRSAVLGQFCAPLCDAVTGSAGSQDMLEEIERRQLFVLPLDNARRWYRYHALFAEMLRSELDRAEPGLVPLLHRRASAWHRQHGTVTEAIDHAIAAGDLAEARELIAAHWHDVLDEGLAETVRGWLDRLPREMVTGDARMCLIRSLLASLQDRPEDIEPWLAAAAAAAPQGPSYHGPASVESATCFYRALRGCVDGDLAAAEPAGRRAAELELESGSACWRARSVALLGAILFWRGQAADAGMLLEQVIRAAHQTNDSKASLLALSFMAAICAQHGDPEAAGRYAREAADLDTRDQVTVVAGLTSADLLAGRGELAAAETAALTALDQARQHRWRLDTAAALLCLTRIYTHAGRAADARTRLGEASDLIAALPDPGILADLLAEAECSAGQPAPSAAPRGGTRRPDGLTGREAEVLGLLTSGHTNLEIAAKLFVSVHTVERHLQNAYRKVGVRNRADAAAYMARDGW
jgi:LuxR family maltose regulon positive regulatory protein